MQISSKILWRRNASQPFLDGKYNRVHQWLFDGGMALEASSSPEIVPSPMSDPALIDPEEAFVASLSSCHMLFFLSIAARKRFIINWYEDNPEAVLSENAEGKTAVISLTLHPKMGFEGARVPDATTIQQLHQLAHSQCFLANSIKTIITIQ